MKTKLAILLSIVLSVPLIANASIIGSGYGAYANTSTASNCTAVGSCSTTDNGDFQSDSAGGEFSTTANSTQNSYATARASAELSGNSYLPTLRVETIADQGRGGFATAFGAQGYTYTGADSFIFNLDYNLHGSVGTNFTGSNGLRADIAILMGNNLEWTTDFGTLIYESGLNPIHTNTLFINNGLDQNRSSSLNFELNPGDMFYVVASIGARSVDGFVDGWNTFSMNFLDNTGLVAETAPAVSAVPVPAAAWLFGSALLGFVGVARRKKVAV